MVAPIGAVVAAARRVVQLQELDDAPPVAMHLGVEALGGHRHDAPVSGQLFGDERRRLLDQRQGGRLQGLHEAGGKTHRDAVPLPEGRAVARLEGDGAVGERLGVDLRRRFGNVALERFQRGVFLRVRTGVDVAQATARLQADVPDPARGLGGGQRGRGDWVALGVCIGHLRDECAVVAEHVFHRDQPLPAVFADQERPSAGAVHEQVAFDALAAVQDQRRDVAVGMRLDPRHMAEDVRDAQALHGVAAQQCGEFHRVQVVAVVDGECVLRRLRLLRRESARDGVRLRRDDLRERPALLLRQPEARRVEVGVFRRPAERMRVRLDAGAPRPAVEARALLEAGVARPEEIALGDADALERGAHRRPGAFADADGGNVRRLHQRHLQIAADVLRGHHVGGEPAGAAAANDDDLLRGPRLASDSIHGKSPAAGLRRASLRAARAPRPAAVLELVSEA